MHHQPLMQTSSFRIRQKIVFLTGIIWGAFSLKHLCKELLQGFLIQNWSLMSYSLSKSADRHLSMPFRLYFLVLILFILHAAFQDNQLYLFVFVAVCAEFYKSHFCVGEILSRCRCGPSAKCVVYTGQRGNIVLFAFFPGGGDGKKEEESYWCSWSWKAWIWACFILNMIVMFWHSLILIKKSVCYSQWSCRVTKQLKNVLKTHLFLVAKESEYAEVWTPK